MKKVLVTEAQLKMIVSESLRDKFGSFFGRNEEPSVSVENVISEFKSLCAKCRLGIKYTMGGEYFAAYCKKSVPNGIDGDIDGFIKLVRASWINDYVSFVGKQENENYCWVKYYLDMEDKDGYMGQQYHNEFMDALNRGDNLNGYKL